MLSKGQQWFYYYSLETEAGYFLHLLTEGRRNFDSRGSFAPFIVFETEQSKTDFIDSLKSHEKEVTAIKPDFWAEQAEKRLKQCEGSVVDPLFLSKAFQYYGQFIKDRLTRL